MIRAEGQGFTLLEVVISMLILALLAGSVYAIVSSSLEASRTATDQQLVLRRLDAFLRITRDAFLNLPAEGSITLEIGRGRGGEPEQRLILGKPQGIFGLPSLAGGALVLASRAAADGTRTMTLLKIPANATDRERAEALEAPGVPLLPKLRKPQWSFKAAAPNSDWKEELPAGSPRPVLARLSLEIDELPEPIEAAFYLPPLGMPPASTNSSAPSPSPTPP